MNRRARLVLWYRRLSAFAMAAGVTAGLLYFQIWNQTTREWAYFDYMPATTVFMSVLLGVVTYPLKRHGGLRLMCNDHEWVD